MTAAGPARPETDTSPIPLRTALGALLELCGMDRRLGFARRGEYRTDPPDVVAEARYYLEYGPWRPGSPSYLRGTGLAMAAAAILFMSFGWLAFPPYGWLITVALAVFFTWMWWSDRNERKTVAPRLATPELFLCWLQRTQGGLAKVNEIRRYTDQPWLALGFPAHTPRRAVRMLTEYIEWYQALPHRVGGSRWLLSFLPSLIVPLIFLFPDILDSYQSGRYAFFSFSLMLLLFFTITSLASRELSPGVLSREPGRTMLHAYLVEHLLQAIEEEERLGAVQPTEVQRYCISPSQGRPYPV